MKKTKQQITSNVATGRCDVNKCNAPSSEGGRDINEPISHLNERDIKDIKVRLIKI